MDDRIRQALEQGRTIDITTTGRKTGAQRRIEIWFHNLDGRIFITGLPGSRDWYANLVAEPRFTFHLKQGVRADLAARATPIVELEQRRVVFEPLLQSMNRAGELERWIAESPLVEVTFTDV